jgi:hypothetical protein
VLFELEDQEHRFRYEAVEVVGDGSNSAHLIPAPGQAGLLQWAETAIAGQENSWFDATLIRQLGPGSPRELMLRAIMSSGRGDNDPTYDTEPAGSGLDLDAVDTARNADGAVLFARRRDPVVQAVGRADRACRPVCRQQAACRWVRRRDRHRPDQPCRQRPGRCGDHRRAHPDGRGRVADRQARGRRCPAELRAGQAPRSRRREGRLDRRRRQRGGPDRGPKETRLEVLRPRPPGRARGRRKLGGECLRGGTLRAPLPVDGGAVVGPDRRVPDRCRKRGAAQLQPLPVVGRLRWLPGLRRPGARGRSAGGPGRLRDDPAAPSNTAWRRRPTS